MSTDTGVCCEDTRKEESVGSMLTRPPILVVEQDLVLRTSITYQIRRAGYRFLGNTFARDAAARAEISF